MTLPITVAIATRNEEANIEQCLDAIIANEPTQVIVVDGESTDDTLKIANDVLFNRGHMEAGRIEVATVQSWKLGLASQRQAALDMTDHPYHMVVDAHHILDANCLRVLLDEIQYSYPKGFCARGVWYDPNEQFSALQACEMQVPSVRYWTNARASANWDITYTTHPTTTHMVGRPALYRTEALRAIGGFDPAFDGVGDEDTDVSIRMQMHGYRQGQGTGIARRVDELDFWTMMHKFVKYGRGDARIIRKYPFKRMSIIKHLLWTYPWNRGTRRIRYWPYFALCGWVRFVAMVWEIING